MMIELSDREVKIVNKLLDHNNDSAIKIKELASEFEVSVRTIKYDLANIREWLKGHDLKLESRRNHGIWIDIGKEMIIPVKEELNDLNRKGIGNSQKKRIDLILLKLIISNKFHTSHELAAQLEVSKNTIINDFEKIERLLPSEQIRLVRKNGLGFSIQGQEQHIRYLLESIIQKNISDYHIFQIIKKLTSDQEDNLQEIHLGLDPAFQMIFTDVLQEMIKLTKYLPVESLDFNEILSFILRTAISVLQMKKEHTVCSYRMIQQERKEEYKGDISYQLMMNVYEKYELPLFEGEFNYIKSDTFIKDKTSKEDIVLLTGKIIKKMAEKTAFPFDTDRNLFNNLFAHLSLRFNKEHLFINEYNPFTDDIKKRDDRLFNNLKKVCSEIIEHKSFFLDESFVAYLALHFLVSQESLLPKKQTVRALYVCSTGSGITNLIQQVVKEEIEDIVIDGFVSILEAKEIISNTEPDLVISIFPIDEVSIPVIKVKPIPDKKDINEIRYQVKKVMNDPHRKKTADSYHVQKKDVKEKQYVKDLLIDAVIVYEKLLAHFGTLIKEEYKSAFQMHVMLLTYRIKYNEQYDNAVGIKTETLFLEKENIRKIEQIFSENDLGINTSEIVALLQYFTRRET